MGWELCPLYSCDGQGVTMGRGPTTELRPSQGPGRATGELTTQLLEDSSICSSRCPECTKSGDLMLNSYLRAPHDKLPVSDGQNESWYRQE